MTTIGLSMIVKNEEELLARCLRSVIHFVDEIIIVDTGSTDRTIEIARSFGAEVHEREWTDDFGVARQESLDLVKSDWAFWLDADDILIGGDKLQEMIADSPSDVSVFYWRYLLGKDAQGESTFTYWRERCIRNDGSFRWAGAAHEVLVCPDPKEQLWYPSISVEHYPKSLREARGPRNLRIMEKSVQQKGDKVEPRDLFYYARELKDSGLLNESLEVFQKYCEVSTWDDERYQASLDIGEIYVGLRDIHKARVSYLSAIMIRPMWPNAYYQLARLSYFEKKMKEVIHWTLIAMDLDFPDTLLFVDRKSLTFDWIIYYTNALYEMGKIESAYQWTKTALKIDPQDGMHLHNLEYFTSRRGT